MELSPRLYRLFVRPPLVTDFYFNWKMSALLSSLPFENRFILDFGCGIGSNCVMFQPQFYIGMDCDTKRISYARRLYPKYKFASFMGEKIPLENSSMDYILICAVLHHIPTGAVEKYLDEFRRILTPTGGVIVIEPCFYDGSHIRNSFMSLMDRGDYIRTGTGYLQLFQGRNFEVGGIKYFNKCFLYREIYFEANPLK